MPRAIGGRDDDEKAVARRLSNILETLSPRLPISLIFGSLAFSALLEAVQASRPPTVHIR